MFTWMHLSLRLGSSSKLEDEGSSKDVEAEGSLSRDEEVYPSAWNLESSLSVGWREPGRVGFLGGIDKKLSEKEEKVLEKKEIEETRREKSTFLASTSSAVSYVSSSNESIKELFTFDESNASDISCHFPENTQNQDVLKRSTENFITPKLVASLDICQLSVRDSVYIIHTVVEALGYNTEEFIINKSSIDRIRQIKRKESAESIKVALQNDIPQILTVHWDGKLLSALNVRDAKEERLLIIVSFGDREQLIGVPKLQNATGKGQAHAGSLAKNGSCAIKPQTTNQLSACCLDYTLEWKLMCRFCAVSQLLQILAA
ncbi:hypothetical protein AVEN_105056-1 [Araneus ventricosus]|uniref:Uncharacterized protein n=1 Tax=Araneus ventricosus TaxID=182803 RepID=A0A4Y2RLD9_ARAVE|nr:hypothetical protein AVEN_105056-1 [Araneus ventricosus]